MGNNNLDDILNIKESHIVNNENDRQSENTFFYEKALSAIANIILIAGILFAIILFFTIGLDKYDNFNLTGFIISISTLASSFIAWVFFHVICNISIGVNKLCKK